MLPKHSNDLKNNPYIKGYLEAMTHVYFNTKWLVFAPSPSKQFVKEETIKAQDCSGPEDQILFWLARIQRYFIVATSDNGVDGKAQTATLITNFLTEFLHLPAYCVEFVCSEPQALNCLVFSIMLCSDTKLGKEILERLKQEQSNPSVLVSMEWYFDFLESKTTSNCEQIVQKISEKYPAFVFPNSPVGAVFKYVACSQSFEKSPDLLKTMGPSLKALLPDHQIPSRLALSFNMIEQGMHAQIYAPHLAKQLTPYQAFWNNTLLHGFRVNYSEPDDETMVFYKPRFQIFLESYCKIALSKIHPKQELASLLGLSYLIRFNQQKMFPYALAIAPKSMELAGYLFDKKEYVEAYALYKDLENGIIALVPDTLHQARKGLYCFFAKVDPWLQDVKAIPQFSEEEAKLLKNLLTVKNVLGETFPEKQVVDIASRLAVKRDRCKDELDRNLYDYYFSAIAVGLTKEQLAKTKAVQPKSQDNSKAKPKVTKASVPKQARLPVEQVIEFTNIVVEKPAIAEPEFPTTLRLEVVPDPVPETVLTTSLRREVSAQPMPGSEYSILNAKVSESLYVQDWPKQLMDTRVFVKAEQPASDEYFPVKLVKKPAKKPRVQINEDRTYLINHNFFTSRVDANSLPLAPESIPEALLALIIDFKKVHPGAKCYLTGGAPADLLHQITPSDYDIIVLYTDLPSIQSFLHQREIYAEITNTKHSVLTCEVAKGINVDFIIRKVEPNQSEEQVLKADFFGRDFTLAGLYCELKDESELQVFSFEQSLAITKLQRIGAIKSPKKQFMDDPIRLFRLLKLIICYPNFTLTSELQTALNDLNPHWVQYFHHFLNLNPNYGLRFNAAVAKLFQRFSYEQINEGMDKLGILSVFASTTKEQANIACTYIPEFTRLIGRHIYWIGANLLMASSLQPYADNTPLKTLMLLSVEERFFIAYLDQRLKGLWCVPGGYVPEAFVLYNDFFEINSNMDDPELDMESPAIGELTSSFGGI